MSAAIHNRATAGTAVNHFSKQEDIVKGDEYEPIKYVLIEDDDM